jgi:hypothetical protein
MIGKLRLERRDERVSEREAEDGEGACIVFEVRRDRLGNDPREPMILRNRIVGREPGDAPLLCCANRAGCAADRVQLRQVPRE